MTDGTRTCRCIVCHDHGDRHRLDAIDRTSIRHVEKCGWSVVQIPEDEAGPGWAFTVGLWHSHRHPELAMFGLDVGVMQECLNVLAGACADGKPAAPDQERDDVIVGYPVLLKTVHPRWDKAFFGTAIAFYRRPPVPFLEVLWPDKAGRFPPAPDCDDAVAHRQPSLWLHPDQHPRGVWTQDL